MSFATLCTAAGVLSLLFGVSFIVAPEQTLATYGRVDAGASGMMLARYFGATLLTAGAALVALRNLDDAGAQRRHSIGLAAATAVALAVALYDVVTGQINALGWSSVVIYGWFVVGFARVGLSAPAALAVGGR